MKKRLTTCEELVMTIIWDSEADPDLMEITSRVNDRYGKTWKPQTVSTFLTRLRAKDYLSMYKKGRYTYYVPCITKQDYRRVVLAGLVQILYGGNQEELTAELIEMV